MITLQLFDMDDQMVGTATVSDGALVVSQGLDELHHVTVIQPGTLQTLTPQDGNRFLYALARTLENPYTRVRVVS